MKKTEGNTNKRKWLYLLLAIFVMGFMPMADKALRHYIQQIFIEEGYMETEKARIFKNPQTDQK